MSANQQMMSTRASIMLADRRPLGWRSRSVRSMGR